MNDVFLKMLNISITASWIILAIILLRIVLHKAPKWINCLLWAIVALRLFMPFSIESIFSLVPSTETIEINEYSDKSIVIHSGIPVIDDNVHAYLKSNYDEPANVTYEQPFDIIEIISIIWLIGVPLMALYGFISYIKVYKQVQISLLHEGNVFYCDSINSPFILGIINPKIYIPSGISDEHVENIIKHEKAHLKRKDHLWKPLGFLLLAIYWFNPFMWIAYILLCRDIEAACDEKVIKSMDDFAKKDYSETLLSCSMQRRMILACPLAFGEVGVKDRIKAVLNYKKPAFWVIVVAVIASVVVAVCFLTNPKEEKEIHNSVGNDAISDDNTNKVAEIDYDLANETIFFNVDAEVYYNNPAVSLYSKKDEGETYYQVNDRKLYIWVTGQIWEMVGELQAHTLTEENFDKCFDPIPSGPHSSVSDIKELRKNNKTAWLINNTENLNPYIILEQKDGKFYIAELENNTKTRNYRIIRLEQLSVAEGYNISDVENLDSDGYEVFATFNVNFSMPEYTVSVSFANINQDLVEFLIIREKYSQNEIQKIQLPQNQIFTDKPIYTVDINFDGNLDLVVPREHPASAAYFIGYVYDAEQNIFIHAPSFEYLSNFIIDSENERILSVRTASQITSYNMSQYDNELKDYVITNSLYWEPDGNNTHLVEEELNDNNEYVVVKDLIIEDMNTLSYDKTKSGFSDYWQADSFWNLDDEIWDNNFFLVDHTDSTLTTTYSGSPYNSPYLKYVDWEELEARLTDEEKKLLSKYMSALKDEEKLYYVGKQISISELINQLNPADNNLPIINSIMFADVFQSGSKDLILRHENAGWGYLILHYENDILYGINMYERFFQSLQENGIYHSAGGASTGYYRKMTFNNGVCTEIDIAHYEREPERESYYLYGKETTSDEFDLWEQNNTKNNVYRYYVEPVEYIAAPLFNNFLNGRISAINKEGNAINISELFEPDSYRQYSEYDMNGDDIPELCIKTPQTLSIFEIKDGKVFLWREDSPYCTVLNNSAILYERHGAAPEHMTYMYYEMDENGNTINEISFEEYESTYIDDMYYPKKYLVNGVEVDVLEYESATYKILHYGNDLINWHDF